MKPFNFELLTLVLVMFLYVLIIVVLLEIVYFEHTLKDLVIAVNQLIEV